MAGYAVDIKAVGVPLTGIQTRPLVLSLSPSHCTTYGGLFCVKLPESELDM
jgi:hypothetical protein